MPTVGATSETSHTDQSMSMAASTLGAGSASGGGPPPRGVASRVFHWYTGPLSSSRTYLALAYLALSFPIGLAVFVALVTASAVSAGLVVTVIGLPLLIATMYGWCAVASFEAQLSNALLGTRLGPVFDPLPARPWQWDAIRARASSVLTWRAFLFLLLRLPQGVAAFIVLSIALSLPFFFITAPLWAEAPFTVHAFGDANYVGTGPLPDGLYLFGRHYGHWYEAMHLLPLGLALVPLSAHAVALGGRLSGLFVTTLLGRRTGGPMSGPPGRREVQAALAWQGVFEGRAFVATDPKMLAIRSAALGIHFGLTVLVLLFLTLLNGIVSPETWWVLWVAWALAMPFALHLGFFLGGHLGAHASLFAVVGIGFFVIDAVLVPDHVWFFWPLLPWLPLLILHAWVTPRLKFVSPDDAGGTPPFSTGPSSGSGPAAFSMMDLSSSASAGNDQATVTLGGFPANVDVLTGLATLSARLTVVDPARDGGPAVTGLAVDSEFRHASVDGIEVDLTPKEFELLSLLVASPGKPYSREQLLDRIWTNEYEVTDRTIDTHVLRLRKKLGPYGPSIQTVWGFGYKYVPATDGTSETPVEPTATVEKRNAGW